MRLVGFSFKKISIEKLSDSFKGVKVNSKINISNIEILKKGVLQEKGEIIEVNFSYHMDYNPDLAKIELGGKVLLMADKNQAKEVEEMWKSNKMSEDFRISLFNIILKKANLKALELEEETGLPLHIPLPTLKKQKKE